MTQHASLSSLQDLRVRAVMDLFHGDQQQEPPVYPPNFLEICVASFYCAARRWDGSMGRENSEGRA